MTPPLILSTPDSSTYQELRLLDGQDPRTWTAAPRRGPAESLEKSSDAFFHDLVTSLNTPAQLIFVSIEQDEAGRHRFISVAAAIQSLLLRNGDKLVFFEEAEVKKLRDESEAILLYARPVSDEADAADAEQVAMRSSFERAGRDFNEAPERPLSTSALTDKELCPHSTSWARNYSVIPDLSLGPTQRLILCDEATLCKTLPEERIFEYLQLIVNCHESKATSNKYKVGSCSTQEPPKAIFQAVHEWHGLQDELQELPSSSFRE